MKFRLSVLLWIALLAHYLIGHFSFGVSVLSELMGLLNFPKNINFILAGLLIEGVMLAMVLFSKLKVPLYYFILKAAISFYILMVVLFVPDKMTFMQYLFGILNFVLTSGVLVFLYILYKNRKFSRS